MDPIVPLTSAESGLHWISPPLEHVIGGFPSSRAVHPVDRPFIQSVAPINSRGEAAPDRHTPSLHTLSSDSITLTSPPLTASL